MEEISYAELTGHSQLTRRDLEQHLRSARRSAPDATIYGFYLPVGDIDFDTLTVDDTPWRLVQAPSELAIRAAIHASQDAPHELLAIITPLKTRDLATDVRIRLPNARLFGFDPWESLLPLFGATQVDWRLNRRMAHALGRALLRIAASQQFPPVEAGILDADTAWNTYFTHALGFDAPPTSMADWLRWAPANPVPLDMLLGDDPELLELLGDRLARQFPDTARTFLAIAHAAHDAAHTEPGTVHAASIGLRILAVGLAAHAANTAQTDRQRKDDQPLQIAAAVLKKALQKNHGLQPTDAHTYDLDRFARQAVSAWESLANAPETRALADRAAELLDTILTAEVDPDHARDLAAFSPASELGWKTLLERAAAALTEQPGKTPHAADPTAIAERLKRATDALQAHPLAARRPGVTTSVMHAARLAFWLATRAPHTPTDPPARARHYIAERSFVDQLREALTFCDPGPELTPAIHTLLARAAADSDAFNHAFAHGLALSLRGSPDPAHALGVHQVLERVVAPLARQHNLLLVVLDGCSWAVARALLADPELESLSAWAPARHGALLPLLATIPSMTEFSRTSLLTGTLQRGEQHTERKEFAAHPALRQALASGQSQRARRAEIFHKKQLDSDTLGEVGSAVSAAIEDPTCGLVAVVVNAIDDQLAASDQVSFAWTLNAVTPLRSLLKRARAAGRTIILTADHGHIWEANSRRDTPAQSPRWRPADPPPADGELRVEGPMIQALTGTSAVVVPWRESLRYTDKKRGYHGGATAQELITPLVILTPTDRTLAPEHFQPISSVPPGWWRLESTTRPPADAPLHDAPTHDAPNALDPLIARLLAAEVFRTRMQTAGQHLSYQDVQDTLSILRANHDRSSIHSLASTLNRSLSSTQRQLTAIARVLNRDGEPVLHFDRATGHTHLNPDLLKIQFQL